jgi:hypothetical protein
MDDKWQKQIEKKTLALAVGLLSKFKISSETLLLSRSFADCVDSKLYNKWK